MFRVLGLAWVVAASVATASAQSVISAQSGLIHYIEGTVYQGADPVALKAGVFPSLKEGQTLRTEAGRAEVLLNPGVFLRLAEDSAVVMADTRLASTRVDVQSGAVLVEAAMEDTDNNQVFLLYKDVTVHLRKSGVYRLDCQPAMLRVYDGEAGVQKGTDTLVIKKGRALPLEGMMVAEKFDPKAGDPFYRWAARRAEYLSLANISAAKRVRDGDVFWGGGRGWIFNPYFGMYTYLPGSGAWFSPFGYRYYSPATVYRVFERPVLFPGRVWDRGPMPTAIPHTSSGYSGIRSGAAAAPSNPSTTAAAAPAAPVRSGTGRAGGSGR